MSLVMKTLLIAKLGITTLAFMLTVLAFNENLADCKAWYCFFQYSSTVTAKAQDTGTEDFSEINICDNAGIYLGQDGYIFREDELYHQWGIDYLWVNILQNAMARHGVELISVVIPDRSQIYPEMVKGSPELDSYDVVKARVGYESFLETLKESGVIVIDVARVMQNNLGKEPLFFKRDNHWTSFASDKVAQEVASKIMTFPEYENILKYGWNTSLLSTGGLKGSLINLINQECGDIFPPVYEDVSYYTTIPTENIDLFTESPKADIVLLGTSNSKRADDFNFSGFLRQYLGTDVLNYAMGGLGAFGSMEAYFLSDDWIMHKPQFIIWEFPLRFIEDEIAFRRIIPAISGRCSEPIFVGSPKQSSFTYTSSSQEVDYIFLELSEATPELFKIEIEYSDLSIATFNISRSTRIDPTGKYFFDLNNYERNDLKPTSLKITLDESTAIDILEVCPYQ